MANHRKQAGRETGAILVVSLLIILVLTLIGVTGMQVTGLEEKMAGNSRDLNLAMQAAEVAVRAGEEYLENLVTVSGFDGDTSGLYSEDDNDPDYTDSTTWSSGINYSGTLQGVTTQPKFLIKLVTEAAADTNAKLNIGGYGETLAGANVTVFRVTGRGTGGSDAAVVILQSHYGKRF